MFIAVNLIRIVSICKSVDRACAQGTDIQYDRSLLKFKNFLTRIKANRDEVDLATAFMFACPAMLNATHADGEELEFEIDLRKVQKFPLTLLTFAGLNEGEKHRNAILNVWIKNGELTSDITYIKD